MDCKTGSIVFYYYSSYIKIKKYLLNKHTTTLNLSSVI